MDVMIQNLISLKLFQVCDLLKTFVWPFISYPVRAIFITAKNSFFDTSAKITVSNSSVLKTGNAIRKNVRWTGRLSEFDKRISPSAEVSQP